jgi:hypothetical protein
MENIPFNFQNDRENGMQNAWRENGKPYIMKLGTVADTVCKNPTCVTLKDQN